MRVEEQRYWVTCSEKMRKPVKIPAVCDDFLRVLQLPAWRNRKVFVNIVKRSLRKLILAVT
jgi:hypothetical protein